MMIFYRSLSDGKSPQVFWILLNLRADISNTQIWIILIRPPISNYSSFFFTKPLRIVPSAPLTTGINIIFMFHSVLSLWKGPSSYRTFHFRFLLCGPMGRQSPLFGRFSFFFLFFFFMRSGLLAGNWRSVCISKCQ